VFLNHIIIMDVSSVIKPSAYHPTENKRTVTEKQKFEQMWQNSISGEEFVQRAHEHIKNLYAVRNKQHAGC